MQRVTNTITFILPQDDREKGRGGNREGRDRQTDRQTDRDRQRDS